jgi:adenosylcobinamide-GDP ribazoletransferase
MKFLLLALSFLTIIPVRLKSPPERGDIGRAAVWFPFIGILIGTMVGTVWLGSRLVVSAHLAALLAVTVWIFMSGGLHLDGLADCCDGMFNASSPGRRLEIMKDPRLGTFGGIGLVITVLLKVALVAELPVARIAWIPFSAALARWTLIPLGLQPLAREGGMGSDFAAGIGKWTGLLAAIPLAALGLSLGWWAAVAIGMALLVWWGIAAMARQRLGGVTGDVMGLCVEWVETAILLLAVLLF